MLDLQRFEEIKKDVLTVGVFNDEELNLRDDSETEPYTAVLESWEFYAIIYLTNAELEYYMDCETIEAMESCDFQSDTPKGRIYCWG